MEETESLVVGCGPAGGTAAREAAAGGVATVVLEKEAVAGAQERFYARLKHRVKLMLFLERRPRRFGVLSGQLAKTPRFAARAGGA